MNHIIGSKYVSGRNITEIAKLVRADIKDAIKAGLLPALKASVTIDRYSMGQSLTVCVTECAASIMNPERVAFELAHPDKWYCMDECPREQFSEEGLRVLGRLAAIVAAYNFDKSDSQTDYYHVNFATHIGFAGALKREQAARLGAGNAPMLSVTIAPEGLAPVIAGPARTVAPVVNEEAARFAFLLGLD